MKNTTFKKKALLSSVAMLLVAIVALGSATFAWFTQNPSVEANGLSLQASTAAGLQILSNSEKALGEDFKTATILNAKDIEGTIATDPDGVTIGNPVSFDYAAESGITFRTTSAASEGNYAKADDAQITGGTASYSEQIYLRTSIAGDPLTVTKASVTITPSTKTDNGTSLAPAIRVMLVTADGDVIGTWSTDGTANKYLTSAGVSSDVYTDAKANGAQATTSIDVDYSGTDYVTAYVWLDGEDDQCYTANVKNLKEIVESINITFAL